MSKHYTVTLIKEPPKKNPPRRGQCNGSISGRLKGTINNFHNSNHYWCFRYYAFYLIITVKPPIIKGLSEKRT